MNKNKTNSKESISTSVVRADHASKVSGRSTFVGDYPSDNVLCGRILRSKYAKARILSVELPELPEGYFYVDAKDIPGSNSVYVVVYDTPVFCRNTVEYIGEAIGMLCGPDEKTVRTLLSQIKVEYWEQEPALEVRSSDKVFFEYNTGHGDVETAFAEADKVYEEEFETGYQEQMYMETQAMMAEPQEDGGLFVHGSMQNPHYVLTALKRVLRMESDKLHVMQDVTGGGFGGKEEYPSILGSQVAVAALKSGKAVRCVLDRREDMECSTKRHPSIIKYKAAVKDGMVTAIDVDVTMDAGAYTTVSNLVLERCVCMVQGVYTIPNARVHGRAVKTNTVPCGAFRGFGGPQALLAVETIMNHIADDLGEEPLDFKKKHLAKQGDYTLTNGKYHFNVPLMEMIDELEEACDYRAKKAEYSKPQTGRYRRGIGLSLCCHGAGLHGMAERDLYKPKVRLHKYKDGTVEILASSSEIGQGVRTTFPKIVARKLDIPLEKVFFEYPDTARVPDSALTAASRSTRIVGELLYRAAAKLRSQWIEGEEQEVEEDYKYPDYMIEYDSEALQGDIYHSFSWSASTIEVEIDTCTGLSRIIDACGVFDIGTPIDYNIVRGQLEGGFLQGIGFATFERMKYNGKGYIRNNNLGDYLVPAATDVPSLRVFIHEEEVPDGPFGANGLGELPLVGAPAAYLNAVEQALGGVSLHHVPFTMEDVVAVLEKEAEKDA